MSSITKSTKPDCAGQSIFVGLDVHKKTWKVAIYHSYGLYKTFSQDPDPCR